MISLSHLSDLAKYKTVLYVEDEKDIRENITSILESIFSNVVVASNGEDGIELSKRNNIDLIISDILMPKCNGLEMVKAIKKEYPQLPVILLTGFDHPEYLLESIDLSINKYLLKPLQKEKLFLALEEVLYIIESRKKEQQHQLSLSKNFKMISIAKLLDNLSHQWRQSLSIISTSINSMLFLEDAKISDKNVQELLSNANKHITKMDDLLKSVISQYNKSHQYENINLFQYVSNTINCFEKKIEENEIKIIFNIPHDLEFSIHKDSMDHIIHNIIENSIDAINTKNIKNGYISIDIKCLEDELIISFLDNGGGINSYIKEEIFEPYSTTKHNYIGTGLGLYIVYILVTKALKGTITANNIIKENQQCAKFTIILPKRKITLF